jgi:hypothetical protein
MHPETTLDHHRGHRGPQGGCYLGRLGWLKGLKGQVWGLMKYPLATQDTQEHTG